MTDSAFAAPETWPDWISREMAVQEATDCWFVKGETEGYYDTLQPARFEHLYELGSPIDE